ncbi:prepilin-type N-terminal cleavage/methylation domain-containing protein [Bacillus sp. CGMCC 1.16607]|uniref:prepilin-type N-terminal cleavage/methylation domain-containing protein n=1 Tax=Bacillus sp. CGMCC 1.16607 TaxID=3351842 RepID=UPI0036361383
MAAPSVIRNEHGLTLLELLLSITLLSIILFTFMGFFTQNAIFIQHNEKKLSTSETAQKVINHIESSISQSQLQSLGILDTSGVKNGTYKITNATSSPLIPTTIDDSQNITLEFSNFTNDPTIPLIQIKVTVQDKDKPSNKSETFTFIRG